MLEVLLSLGCIYGNQSSCETTGKAYYSYSGLERKINKFNEQHVKLTFIAGTVGVIRDKKLMIPVYRKTNNAIDLELKDQYQFLTYKIGF